MVNEYSWSLSRERDGLAHHGILGILGMKWGIRRHQNEDGSKYDE